MLWEKLEHQTTYDILFLQGRHFYMSTAPPPQEMKKKLNVLHIRSTVVHKRAQTMHKRCTPSKMSNDEMGWLGTWTPLNAIA